MCVCMLLTWFCMGDTSLRRAGLPTTLESPWFDDIPLCPFCVLLMLVTKLPLSNGNNNKNQPPKSRYIWVGEEWWWYARRQSSIVNDAVNKNETGKKTNEQIDYFIFFFLSWKQKEKKIQLTILKILCGKNISTEVEKHWCGDNKKNVFWGKQNSTHQLGWINK